MQERCGVFSPEGQLQGLFQIYEATLVFRDIRGQPKIQSWYDICSLAHAAFSSFNSRKEN